MHRKLMQAEVPGLFLDLALGRVAVLVQRLKIAENTGNLFTSNTKFLGIHKFSTPGVSRLGWARRGPRITTTSRHSQVSRRQTRRGTFSCGKRALKRTKVRNCGLGEQTKGESHRGDFVTKVWRIVGNFLPPIKPFSVAKCLIKGENSKPC